MVEGDRLNGLTWCNEINAGARYTTAAPWRPPSALGSVLERGGDERLPAYLRDDAARQRQDGR